MNENPARLTWKASALWVLLAVVSFHAAYAWKEASALLVLYVFSLIQLARTESWRQAAYSGLAVGFLIASGRLDFFWKVFGTGAFALWMVYAFWIALFVALVRLCVKCKLAFATWLLPPFIWTGLEYFRSELYYLRFSWLSPGYGFLPGQLPFGLLGVYGIGFLLATLAASANALWLRSRVQGLAALLVFIIGLTAAGSLLESRPLGSGTTVAASSGPGRSLTVAGIQMEFPDEKEVLFRLSDLIRKHPETDLLVLSEYTFADQLPPAIRAWCRENHRYLIIGAEDPCPGNYYDTAFVISPSGEVIFKQAKAVPIQFMKDGLPAREQKLWDSPWGKIGICVCYDLSYTRITDKLVRLGAQALVVPTMDVLDWGNRQHRLHARIAPVRAAEYGIPIFRVASSGISQCVDSRGRILAEAPCPGDGSTLCGTLDLGSQGTLPLDRWLAPFSTAIAAIVVVWFLIRERLLRASRAVTTINQENPREPDYAHV